MGIHILKLYPYSCLIDARTWGRNHPGKCFKFWASVFSVLEIQPLLSGWAILIYQQMWFGCWNILLLVKSNQRLKPRPVSPFGHSHSKFHSWTLQERRFPLHLKPKCFFRNYRILLSPGNLKPNNMNYLFSWIPQFMFYLITLFSIHIRKEGIFFTKPNLCLCPKEALLEIMSTVPVKK